MWFVENWEVLAGIITGLLGVAYGIAKLTKTKKDDEAVEQISEVWDEVKPEERK